MKKGLAILLAGLLLGASGFGAFYYFGTASCRDLMHEDQPELAWLKKEFKLSDAEFARIAQLHAAYLPQCAKRCQRIEELNRELRGSFSAATNLTPAIEALLAERANVRATCEGEMMKHFLAVSRTMPPEQGQRYLAWVQEQTFMHGEGMEARHRTADSAPAAHHHHSP